MAKEETQVPCYFTFGDSLYDNGNNNPLLTAAKANYAPYGIDFPRGPTGRFSNGVMTPDVIAKILGFVDEIPPFATARGANILRGVNYASGGAGIRDETGRQLGDVISMNRQLVNHGITILRITTLQGNNVVYTANYLKRCLYVVGMGNNDYLNNYLMPQFYPTSGLFTLSQFAAVLAQEYSRQLRLLYDYNARKIAIFGVGLLGCIAAQLATNLANGSPCVESVNNAVQLFNDRLKDIVNDLNRDLPDAKFIYINMTSISSGDPSTVGIRVVNASCCKVLTTIAAQGKCDPGQVPCSNRNEYYFWDNFHPTEIGNRIVGERSYNSVLPTDAYPMDIHRLVQLQN